MLEIADSKILADLSLILPDGLQREEVYCNPVRQWKLVTDSSMIREVVRHFPVWEGVNVMRVGGTHYGDEIIVTESDPISPSGAIYAIGEVSGPVNAEHWPEGLLRLGFSAKQWIDRINEFGDDYCVCPGSIDEMLGERANDYRIQLRTLNPKIVW